MPSFAEPIPAPRATNLAWSNDGSYLAIVHDFQRITILETSSFQPLMRIESAEVGINDLSWNADGTRFATINALAGHVDIWNSQTGTMIGSESIPNTTDVNFARVSWNSTGDVVAGVVSNIESGLPLHFWSVEGDVYSLMPLSYGVNAYDISWNPNGRTIAVANIHGIYVFDNVRTLEEPRLVAPFQFAIAYSPSGEKLAGVDTSGRIQIIDPVSGAVQREIAGDPRHPSGRMAEIAWMPDDVHLVTYGYYSLLELWNTQTGEQIYWLNLERDAGRDLMSISPSGGRIAVGGIPLLQTGIETLQTSIGYRSIEHGSVQIIIPDASTGKLESILKVCDLAQEVEQLLLGYLDVGDYAEFLEELEAQPEHALPTGCHADLIAIAEVLMTAER